MTPETGEKAAIRQGLAYKGWHSFPVLQGLGCYPGVPDLVCIKDGVVVLVEVKARDKRGKLGKHSDKQKRFQEDWELYGGKYVIGDFDMVMEAMKAL